MLIRLLVVVVALQIVLPVAVWLMRDRVIFLPSALPTPGEALRDWPALGKVLTLVEVERTDGRRLAAWDARPAELPDDAPVVLFLHGNAGNIAHRADVAASFATGLQARVLMPDYSGYGGNDGSPSIEEVGLDARAAYDHLVADGVAPGRIVLYGESIGGALALQLGARVEVGGVITQSTFASLSSMARRVYGWLPLTAVLARGELDGTAVAPFLTGPLLLVHGDRDRIVPPAERDLLLAAAPPDRVDTHTVVGAGHNDLLMLGGAEYRTLLRDRVRAWTATTPR